MRLRRHTLVIPLLVFVLDLGGAGCGGSAAPPENLLLVTIDTLRADHLGVYGGPFPTPALDGLAAEGVALRQGYTPTPTTGPAHASLFTGLYPWHHGVLNNAVPLHPEMPTLAVLLRARGFATAAFVASYVLHPRFGFDAGFDTYEFVATEKANWHGRHYPEFYARGGDITAKATAWLQAHDGEPFFLWLHYFDPHLPYDPAPEFAFDPDVPVDLAGKALPSAVPSRAALKGMIRAYRGEVRGVDAEIGALLAAVEALALADTTAVVVTSDHGEGLGDHRVLDHGQNLFEEQIRVPLIVRGPGIPARGALAGLAQLEDLMPTLLGLLAAPVPDGLDGLDLSPWLRGEASRSPRVVVLGRRKELPDGPRLFYERGGEGKWIGPLDGGGRRFDLASDPRERAGQREAPPAALIQDLVGGAASVGVQDLDAESRRALEALGYLEAE